MHNFNKKSRLDFVLRDTEKAMDIDTQGNDIPDAICMARDAINLWGVGAQDMNLPIPEPSALPVAQAGETVTLVDVDFESYRRTLDTTAVRKMYPSPPPALLVRSD